MASRSSSVNRSRNASSTTTNSGINLSRAQEKEQLETLNNRLAVYIDTVRRLEQDNRELKVRRNQVFVIRFDSICSRLERHRFLHGFLRK